MTKDNLRKLLDEARTLSKEFGKDIRPAYAIDIAGAGGVQWMVPERWFFRYLEAFSTLIADGEGRGDGSTRESIIAELDEGIDFKLTQNCSERHQ